VARRHHAGDALGAAGAGEQPDFDLGQTDARPRVVGRNPMMAGEAELESATERYAVDRGDPRLAAGLDPPVQERDLAALLVEVLDRHLLALRLHQVGEFP